MNPNPSSPWLRFIAPALCAIAILLAGCQKDAGATFDLSKIEGKVSPGMTEQQVVGMIGVPSKISVEGDYRELRYDSKDGNGHMIVTLRNNVVVEGRKRD